MTEKLTEKEMKDERVVELVSKDGQKLRIKRKYIMSSKLIKDMLEEQDDDDDEIPSIPVPNVESHALKLIIEYCEHHWNNKAKEIEKPLKGEFDNLISDYDKKFLDVDQSRLIELLMASNYMNIRELLTLTCAKVASMIKGKNPTQIRTLFNIENDFSPEEERKIREENKWCS